VRDFSAAPQRSSLWVPVALAGLALLPWNWPQDFPGNKFPVAAVIRAISAHGRMTGTVLSLIPASVGVLMFYVNPQYILFFLHDPTGQWMMGASIALQFVGYAVIKKIVSIEV
jgi:hypothetical protein